MTPDMIPDTTDPGPPETRADGLLEAFHEIGRSLEIGRTGDTVLAGLRHVVPACDRATLTVIGLYGSVVCRRARGRGQLLPDIHGPDLRGPDRKRNDAREVTAGGLVEAVIESGRPELLGAPGVAADPELDPETASAVAAPLLGAGGRRLGAVVAESLQPSAFADRDAAALRAYAAGATPAIERILFYEKALEGHKLVSELEVAGRVLHDLLPHGNPSIEGLEVAAVYEPSSQVGGDYYDFVPLGEERWGIAMGDVAGQGNPGGAAGRGAPGLGVLARALEPLAAGDPGQHEPAPLRDGGRDALRDPVLRGCSMRRCAGSSTSTRGTRRRC